MLQSVRCVFCSRREVTYLGARLAAGLQLYRSVGTELASAAAELDGCAEAYNWKAIRFRIIPSTCAKE